MAPLSTSAPEGTERAPTPAPSQGRPRTPRASLSPSAGSLRHRGNVLQGNTSAWRISHEPLTTDFPSLGSPAQARGQHLPVRLVTLDPRFHPHQPGLCPRHHCPPFLHVVTRVRAGASDLKLPLAARQPAVCSRLLPGARSVVGRWAQGWLTIELRSLIFCYPERATKFPKTSVDICLHSGGDLLSSSMSELQVVPRFVPLSSSLRPTSSLGGSPRTGVRGTRPPDSLTLTGP